MFERFHDFDSVARFPMIFNRVDFDFGNDGNRFERRKNTKNEQINDSPDK